MEWQLIDNGMKFRDLKLYSYFVFFALLLFGLLLFPHWNSVHIREGTKPFQIVFERAKGKKVVATYKELVICGYRNEPIRIKPLFKGLNFEKYYLVPKLPLSQPTMHHFEKQKMEESCNW